ncbi:MAG: hypothetical protein ACREIW_10100 [Chthoniobacterales bacterium]
MSHTPVPTENPGVVITIGEIPIAIRVADPRFVGMLRERYNGFLTQDLHPRFEFAMELTSPDGRTGDEDAQVRRAGRTWSLDRGDFHAEWDPDSSRGYICQNPNPYSMDAVLRIVHTLLLAREGGFLVHAASAVRNGRAFIFAGVSGRGKTTISRLAPSDAVLLTDEISYVRKQQRGYSAFGTPFTGELAKSGENIQAPIAALYLLAQGSENRIEQMSRTEAIQGLLSNILFFAEDAELVRLVFEAACEFVECVPVQKLTFVPDARVWEMIR